MEKDDVGRKKVKDESYKCTESDFMRRSVLPVSRIRISKEENKDLNCDM